MARMRTLRPEACWSESLAELDRAIRWTFAVLWTHCDDEGRAVNNPRVIKGALYPLDDEVTPAVVTADISELERVGAVCLYEVRGKRYLHVPSWSEYQRPNRKVPSKLPPCPKSDHSPPIHVHLSEDSVSEQGTLTPVVVDVVGDVDVAVATPPRTRAVRLDRAWVPDPLVTQDGFTEVEALRELEVFRDYWCALGGQRATKIDWQATWRNWVRKSQRPSNGRVKTPNTSLSPWVNQ